MHVPWSKRHTIKCIKSSLYCAVVLMPCNNVLNITSVTTSVCHQWLKSLCTKTFGKRHLSLSEKIWPFTLRYIFQIRIPIVILESCTKYWVDPIMTASAHTENQYNAAEGVVWHFSREKSEFVSQFVFFTLESEQCLCPMSKPLSPNCDQ